MRGAVEAQIERGTVLEILPGPPVRARVLLAAGPGCEECGARAFCCPEDVERRSLLARVPAAQGFSPAATIPRPGEQVRVAVSGSRVLAAGMWAYGFPLLGLCCGLGLGWTAFAGHAGRELLASLLGLIGGAVPFAVLWARSRSHPADEWFDACLVPGESLTDRAVSATIPSCPASSEGSVRSPLPAPREREGDRSSPGDT